jgi:TP53 regulating kinase-like protein
MEIGRGAEAVITLEEGVVSKKRLSKGYRRPELDEQLRRERTLREAKITSEARRLGVPTPILKEVCRFELKMEHVEGRKLKSVITPELSERVGEQVGRLHQGGIVHGDLTTSNMIQSGERIYFIDFGLASYDSSVEAKGVDCHVFFQTLHSTHDQAEDLIAAFCAGYKRAYPGADAVLERVREIKARGRYL